MEKRVTFKGWLWLPLLLLIAPQVVITVCSSSTRRAGDLAVAVHPRPVRPVDAVCRARQFRVPAGRPVYRASFVTPRLLDPGDRGLDGPALFWRCWPTG
jgi:hypothetical protein